MPLIKDILYQECIWYTMTKGTDSEIRQPTSEY